MAEEYYEKTVLRIYTSRWNSIDLQVWGHEEGFMELIAALGRVQRVELKEVPYDSVSPVPGASHEIVAPLGKLRMEILPCFERVEVTQEE